MNRLVRRSLHAWHDAVVGGRYRVLGTIGSGGMGSVYEAVDLQTGLPVALKALPPGAQNQEHLRRLRREAATAASVKSPFVCEVFYLGVDSGTPFIVMELLHGETLRTRLDQAGPLTLDDAVAVLSQLLDGLTAMHAVGIVHRDIKPSNVFLVSARGDEPRLKVIDFGLATLTERAKKATPDFDDITSADQITGTLSYLAPEQILPVGELDARIDLYSAGVCFFEMLTGRRAYSGTWMEIVNEIILGEPPKVTAFRDDIPALFDDVLAMAMARSRDRRFSSAEAFKRAVLSAYDAASVMRSGVVPKMTDEVLDSIPDDVDAITIPPPRLWAATIPDAYDQIDVETDEDEIPTIPPPPFMRGR